MCGWQGDAAYDDSSWEEALVYNEFQMPKAVSPGNLFRRTIPYMNQIPRKFTETVCVRASSSRIGVEQWNQFLKEEGNSITIPPHSHEVVEISAGEEMTGYLQLAAVSGAETTVKILEAEAYSYKNKNSNHPFQMPRKGNRTDWKEGRLDGFTDTYTVTGFGTKDMPERYEPFWFRTFRFIQLANQLTDQNIVGKNGGVNGREAYWSFIDWIPQWDQTQGDPKATLQGPITMESLLYILGLQYAAALAEYIGRTEGRISKAGRAGSESG